MITVAQNEKFENFRDGYSSTKRPVDAPSIRSVQARLEHENALNEVNGFGKRKIPTSTQRPTRGTNVSIVYSRISRPREVHDHDLQQGDIMFVCKSDTKFGAGLNRLTRVANLTDVNLMLSDKANFIFEDEASIKSILMARHAMSKEYAELSTHLVAQRCSMLEDRSKCKKREWSYLEIDSYIDLVCERRSFIDSAIADVERSVLEGKSVSVYPELDWAYVPVLQNWAVDGVLYGIQSGCEVIDSIVLNSSTSDQLVNVCLQGPCPTRNQKLAKVPQFFDNAVTAGEYVYACIVAIPGDIYWRYKIGLMSSRQANELLGNDSPTHVAKATPGSVLSEFTKADLLYTVAAWKLGRVVDTCLTTGIQSLLMLDVEVCFMDRLHFLRHLIGSDGDVMLISMSCKRVMRHQNLPINSAKTPSSADLVAPVVPALEALSPAAPLPPPPTPPIPKPSPAPIPSPSPRAYPTLTVSGDFGVTPRKQADDYEESFKFGFATREVAAAVLGGVFSLAQISIEWFSQKNDIFPEYDNTTVAVAVNTYSRALVASKSTEYQKAYFMNSVNLTGFVNATDRFFVERPSWTIKEYEDFCGLLSLVKDNGLIHALCRALESATVDGKVGGRKVFPYTLRSAGISSGSTISMLSFKLPPQEGDVVTLQGLVDIRRFLDMAPGDGIAEKSAYMSASLNFLFDLPFNTQWSTVDIGLTWVRPTTDSVVWDVHSEARSAYISDVVYNSRAMGTGLSSSSSLIKVVTFGTLTFNSFAPQTIQQIAFETKGIKLTSKPLDTPNMAMRELITLQTSYYSVNKESSLSVYDSISDLPDLPEIPSSNVNTTSLASMKAFADSDITIIDVNNQDTVLKQIQRALYDAAILTAGGTAGVLLGLTMATD